MVISANSAGTALTILQNKPVNAVVPDFEMAEMDGLQFATAAHKSYPTLPFFIMSGREPPLDVDPGLFAAWIHKGSSLAELRDELLIHLAREAAQS